jgi:hypothetical protein
MKRAGEARPVPTTMQSSMRSAHVERTLSSMDLRFWSISWTETRGCRTHLVSQRRLFSDLIQSSSRPRKR